MFAERGRGGPGIRGVGVATRVLPRLPLPAAAAAVAGAGVVAGAAPLALIGLRRMSDRRRPLQRLLSAHELGMRTTRGELT